MNHSITMEARTAPPAQDRSALTRYLLRPAIVGVLVVVGGFVVPRAAGSYWQVLVTQAAAYTVAVVGYNLVVGEAGLFSLGHAAFMGLGVYGYAVAASRGTPTLVALAVSLGLTLAVAVVIGLITLRLRDVYFAIGTFCAAAVLQNIVSQLTSLTGGDQGIVIPPLHLFGLHLGGTSSVYAWVIGSVVAAVFLHEAIARGRFGRILRCIRDDEEAAEAMGIRLMRNKLLVFVIAAGFAAWGGWLYALSLQYVDPNLLGVDQTVLILVMLVVGGAGSVVGAIVAALLIWLTPQLLQPLASWWQFTYGMIVLLSVLAGRRGLAGMGTQLARQARRKLFPSAVTLALESEADGVWQRYTPARPIVVDGPLVAREVTKRYGGVTALESVDVEFVPGTVHALIGPNGSGKTTLLNAITGVAKPTSGEIAFSGGRLTMMSADAICRLGVARTFQTPRLFPQVSVIDNVRPMAELAGLRGRSAFAHALACLGTVGLAAYANEHASDLPQGYRRLLEIARALALTPRVFLLDEPAAGLAEGEWGQLQSLLRGLADGGMCIVIVEHNMPFLMELADAVTVLQTGHVLAEGTPAEIQANPQVREAYMGT